MKMTIQRKTIQTFSGSLLALSLAACGSSGLGDGVKLESIEIRTVNATLNDAASTRGNAGENLTVGQCVFAPFSIRSEYSDGEIAEASGRATLVSDNPSKIVIINTRDPSSSLNQQFPLAIAPTEEPVTITADFAGVIDTVDVTVLPSELRTELPGRTFAIGVNTPLEARLVSGPMVNGEVQARISSDRTNQADFTSDSSTLLIGSKDDEGQLSEDLPNGVLSSDAAATATVTATLDALTLLAGFGDSLSTTEGPTIAQVREACGLESTITVSAAEPSAVEIVPNFVSPNSAEENQSSANQLVLASGTSASVTVNALFGDSGARQDITSRVVWERTDGSTSNDGDRFRVPGNGSSIIVADSDDHLLSPAQLVAVVVRGDDDEDEDRAIGDLDDLNSTLGVTINNYDATDIRLVAQPASNNPQTLAFSSVSPLRLFGLFGSPDEQALTADLVLRLDRGVVLNTDLFNAQGDDDDDNLSVLALVSLSSGSLNAQSKAFTDNRDDVASEQRLSFDLLRDGETIQTSNVLRLVTNETDLENIQPPGDDNEPEASLFIGFDGESTEAADVCIEVGETVTFDALLSFADELDEDDNATPVLPARVSEAAVWSIGDSRVATVLNGTTLRGRVTGLDVGTTTLSISYVNPANTETNDDVATRRFEDEATLNIEVAASEQCGEAEPMDSMTGGIL